MSRSKRRSTSRALAVVLMIMLAAGILFALSKFRGSGGNSDNTPVASAEKDPSQAVDSPAGGVEPKGEMMPLLAVAEDEPLIRTETPVIGNMEPVVESKGGDSGAAETVPVSVGSGPALTLSGDALADGQAYINAGDVIRARQVLNDALVGGRLSGADEAAAKERLAEINQEAVLGRRVYQGDPLSELYSVKPGDVLQRIARQYDVTWELLCRVNGISDPRRLRAGQTIKVVKGPFHAVVSKSQFTMDIYLGAPGGPGSMYVMSFPVGLGKDDSTPAGTWVVDPNKKLKNPTYFSPRGEGIIAADDPKNPLGEYWIGLKGLDGQAVGQESYGIHGTIDPESIGKMESMGCIRLRNEDVALVYEMMVDGKSRVVVKE